jgi:hypothetical protein
MITLLLHLLRLLPFVFGGHRQLALENLTLRSSIWMANDSGWQKLRAPERTSG